MLGHNTDWHLFTCCCLADCTESMQSCHLLYKLSKHRKYVLGFLWTFPTRCCLYRDDQYIQMYQAQNIICPKFSKKGEPVWNKGTEAKLPGPLLTYVCPHPGQCSILEEEGAYGYFCFLLVLFKRVLIFEPLKPVYKTKEYFYFTDFFDFLENTCISCLRVLSSALFSWENISSPTTHQINSFLPLNIIFLQKLSFLPLSHLHLPNDHLPWETAPSWKAGTRCYSTLHIWCSV